MCLKSGKKHLLICTLFITLIFYLSSINFIANNLIKPLEDKYKPINNKQITTSSAFVVLGSGIVEKSPEENFLPTLSLESLKRTDYAISLFNRFHLPIIATGGTSTFKDSSFSEGYVMANFLYKAGLDKKFIIAESASHNTFESAINVKKIADRFKFDRIILVTSAYHMPRAVYIFKKFNMDILPAPTDYKRNTLPLSFFDFFPTLEAFILTSAAIHEYVGLFYYKIKIRIYSKKHSKINLKK